MPPKSLIRFLTPAQVCRLHTLLVLPHVPLTQPSLLMSATSSPQNTHHYTGQSDVFHLAAILAERVMKNHAFGDGNKRAGAVSAKVFLALNGLRLTEGEREGSQRFADAHVRACTGEWDAEELGRFYEACSSRH